MRRFFIASTALLFFFSAHVSAEQVFCATNMSELRSALGAWTMSADTVVTIRLVQGTYALDSANGQTLGDFQANTSASLQILGGYVPGCMDRVVDPRNTVIDGRNDNFSARAKLRLSNVDGDVFMDGLTFTRLPDGISIIHSSTTIATGHHLRVSHSRIIGNDTWQGSGQPGYTLSLRTVGANNSGGEVALENSVVANNRNQGFGLASALTSGDNGRIVMTGDTITLNSSDPFVAAIKLQDFSQVSNLEYVVMNNIAWHNGTAGAYADIDVSNAPQPPAITYTLAANITGTIQPTMTNLSSDPRFLSPSAGNFRLGPQSPAIDAGSASQPDGFPALDLDGRQRVAGVAVDLGAYEAVPGDEIFYSGFDD